MMRKIEMLCSLEYEENVEDLETGIRSNGSIHSRNFRFFSIPSFCRKVYLPGYAAFILRFNNSSKSCLFRWKNKIVWTAVNMQ